MISRRTAILFLVAAAAVAGCRATTETTTAGGSRQFRHNGLHFAVDVPQDWAIAPLEGSVVLELRGPRAGERGGPVADVFTRTETREVRLDDQVPQLLELMKHDLRFQLEERPTAPVIESTTLAGRPAKLIRRTSHEGPLAIDQQIWIVAEGRQVWTLLLSVPAADQKATEPALETIRKSFEVW
jgi:hypothetical protein